MRKVALITDVGNVCSRMHGRRNSAEIRGDRGGCQSVHFNSTGNWSRDAGYNRAEYNIYNLPELSDFDGIILELNNISSPAVLADVISNAKQSKRFR